MKTKVAAVIAAGMMVATNAEAATIVYAGTQHIAGATAAYSITTDGTTGTLTAANVVDYTITLSKDGVTNILNPQNSGLRAAFLATANLLSVSGTQELHFNNVFAPSSNAGGNVISVGYTDFLLFYDGGTQVGFKYRADGLTGTTAFSPMNNAAGFASSVSTVAPVPEPATWAMMLFGFGMVAGAARYRRRSVKVSLA